MTKNVFNASDYTCSSIFADEMRNIFSDCWYFAGLVEDLKESNQFLTVQAGNNNLVVTRNDKGELNAFHNICRHRGMQIFEGSGELQRTVTCPYHDWTYNQCGELKSLPKAKQEFSGLDKSCLSLKKASVGIWRGMIWVHPDCNATPVASYFAKMDKHIAPYKVEQLVEAKDYIYEAFVQANWKLVVENYVDHYHLAQLHSGTLAMYQHDKAEFGFVDEHFHFWEPLANAYAADLANNAPYPLIIENQDINTQTSNEGKMLGAWVPLLFPNTGLVETESSWSVFHIIPLAVDKTKVVVRSKTKNCGAMQYLAQASRSYSFWQQQTKSKYKKAEKTHPLGSADFMAEDIYVCEQLQKSLTSPYFEFGPSAINGESGIRGIQQRIKARMSGG